MLSMGLWRWYINITIPIQDIVNRPVFYLKHNISETGVCLRLQVEPTQLSSIYRSSLCLRRQETESSLRNAVFWIKDGKINNVQDRESYFKWLLNAGFKLHMLCRNNWERWNFRVMEGRPGVTKGTHSSHSVSSLSKRLSHSIASFCCCDGNFFVC
jgi:hypothetical protein